MKKSILFVAAILIMVATVGGILHFKLHQRLGKPGVKLGPTPLLDPTGKKVAEESVILPENVSGFEATSLPVSDIELNVLPKDTMFGKKMYKADDGFVSAVSVVLMGADRTSIHKPEICLVTQGWTIDKSEMDHIKMKQPIAYELTVMKMTATLRGKDKNGQPVTVRGIYVYWFVADNLLTATHRQRMLWMARDLLLTGALDRWAYVAYFAQCAPGGEEPIYQRLKDLIVESVPQFQLVPSNPLIQQKMSSRSNPAELNLGWH
jgi:hypothetical protein